MTLHAIEQARKKDRGGLELTFEDLRIILDRILEGDAKEIKKPRNVLGLQGNGILYNIRYNGVLLQAVVVDAKIVTFNPIGKKNSWNKTQVEKSDKGYLQMVKRKKKEK